jgi:serine/threonine protein phosphatase PrpC
MNYRTSQNGETLSVVDKKNGIAIQSSFATSVGMVRGNNEDSVELWGFDDFVLALVADGMGGAAGGEEASRLAVEAIHENFVEALPETDVWEKTPENEITDKLRESLMVANQSVLDKASQDHLLHGMGTTATMVLIQGKRAIFAHVGDSRAYLVDSNTNEISQITSDHSFVEALVISGHLTREQAEVHPMKNVLYRALGQKPDSELEIDIYTHDLNIGDRLVLCSDGLSRHLPDNDIARITLASDEAAEVAQNLIDLANERGGEDNVSAIVLFVESHS